MIPLNRVASTLRLKWDVGHLWSQQGDVKLFRLESVSRHRQTDRLPSTAVPVPST